MGTGVGVGVGCDSTCTSAYYWSTDTWNEEFGLFAQPLLKPNRFLLFLVYLYIFFLLRSITETHLKSFSTVGKWTSTYPGTLSSNKLVIFSLDTGPTASIIVLLLKVRVVFQLLWCLWETKRQNRANSQRKEREKVKKKKSYDSWIDSWKRAICFAVLSHCAGMESNRQHISVLSFFIQCLIRSFS